MWTKASIAVLVVAGVVLAVCFAWPHIDFFMLTGHSSPVVEIETLRHPLGVRTWGPHGLLLADRRTVQLPGLSVLPAHSDALSAAVERGVEVGDDGRVWALVPIHHWCGNDPVREHLARVDLAEMLIFLRVGEPVVPLKEVSGLPEPGGSFSESGWNVSEFVLFTDWEQIRIRRNVND